jgi:hypothetical protein
MPGWQPSDKFLLENSVPKLEERIALQASDPDGVSG